MVIVPGPYYKERIRVDFASDMKELEMTLIAYDKAGWDLIAMTEEHGYTLVFRRRA